MTANASATRGGGRATIGGSTDVSGGGVGGAVRNSYNVSLDVNWEIDLWGRVRRTVEAGEATAQASVADLEAAKLSAQAQLAEDYFLLRAQDAQIRLLTETVDAYQKSLQLTRNQYAVGVAARADVAQAETQLKSTQAQALDAGVQRTQLEHAIAVLLGKAPADFSIAPEPVADLSGSLAPPSGFRAKARYRGAERGGRGERTGRCRRSRLLPVGDLSATGGFKSSVLCRSSLPCRRCWCSVGGAAMFDAGLRRAQTAQAMAPTTRT